MSKDNKFAFISESFEPLLLADFKTRQVLAISDSLTKLFGSSSDKLVNSKLDSIIAVPGKGVDLGSFFEKVEKRGVAKLERVVPKLNESHSRFLEIYASLLPDKNKKLVRIWAHDITQRKRSKTQLELQKLTEYLDTILLNMPAGLAILEGPEFRYFRINHTLAAINGLSVEEHLGRPLAEILPHAALDIVPGLLQVLETGVPSPQREFSARLPKNPLEDRHFSDAFFPIFGEDGKPRAVGAVVVDITERKRAEESLLYYQHIVSSSKDMLALLNKNFVYLAVNDNYAKAFGKTRDEIVGSTISDVFGDTLFKTKIRPNAEKCLQGHDVHKENWVDFPVFGSRFMEVNFTPYRGPDNEIKGFVVNGRDITDRKRAEEAIHYQDIVSNARDMLALLDKNFVYLAVNENYVKAMGATHKDIIGKAVSETDGDMLFESVIRSNAEKCLLGDEVSCESWFEFPDIGKRHMEVSYSPYRGSDNEIKGLVVNARDITERKQAKEALQKSEVKFQKAFKSSPDAITITRLSDGRFVEVNPSSERMLGYTRQEVIGKTSLELGVFKNPADREVLKNILQKEFRVRDIEIDFRRKSGDILTCRVSAELIDLHGETCLLAISRDITESKRAEEALREANERFQLAFEIANIAICLVDIDVRFTLVNEQMCKMFGYTKEELEGMTFMDITHPEDVDVGLRFLQRALSGEIDDARFIKRYLHKDGHIVWAELSTTIVRNAQGNPLHFISYILDITESKRAEETLRANEKSLSHAQQIAHLGSWEYNFVSRKSRWSDEAYRIFEINLDESSPSYESYLETIHPDDRALVDKVYIESIQDMTACELEYRLVMKDGRIKYIRDRWENWNDNNGKPLISFGTMLDITDRVRHEKEIQDRKSRLSLVKDIAMEITSEMSIEEVVANSLKDIFKMHPDYRVSYGVRTRENLYKCMVSVGPSSMKNIEGSVFYMSDALEFVKALTKGTVVTNDVLSDELVAPLRSQLEEIQVRAMINTPVTHAVGLKGLIWLDSDIPHRWTDHEIATLAEVSRYLAVAVKNAQLAEEKKKTAASLKEALEKLRAESEELTLKNIALNQVLKHLENEKQNHKEQISESVESLLMPIVKKLKKRDGNLSPKDISLLENSLNSIVGKGIDDFRKNLVKLSPRELDICELIREGKSSKEISSVLNLSTLTIHKHRESIRSKLQLKNKSTNLSAYLRTREFLTGHTQLIRN